MTNYIEGLIASKGLAIGKAYVLKKEKIHVQNDLIDEVDIEEEINKFNRAVEESLSTIDGYIENSIDIKDFVTTQREFIADPFLRDTVIRSIKTKRYSADYALKSFIEDMVDQMNASEDQYFKERAIDYQDVGDKLLYKLKGIEYEGLSNLKESCIIVSEDLTPSETTFMKREYVQGIINDLGGITSHSSIIAQTLSIPSLVGTQTAARKIKDGDLLILDALNGRVVVNPQEEELSRYFKILNKINAKDKSLKELFALESKTKDGTKINLVANVTSLDDISMSQGVGSEGVGLFRTEYIYMDAIDYPSEEKQFLIYKRAAIMSEGRPVKIRTLDIGADKSLPYSEHINEDNPFLGWRGIRLCLDHPDLFKVQLRAILRASIFGDVKIILPMITSINELRESKNLIEECKKELREEGKVFDEAIEVGVMIETPASVFIRESLIKECDFFSLGTNDLTQYILAADRGNDRVQGLSSYYSPAVLKAIKEVIDTGHKHGKTVSLCGIMASDTLAIYLLLGLGLEEFSVVSSQILRVKDIILNTDLAEAKKFADRILELDTTEEVIKELKKSDKL